MAAWRIPGSRISLRLGSGGTRSASSSTSSHSPSEADEIDLTAPAAKAVDTPEGLIATPHSWKTSNASGGYLLFRSA